MKFYVAGINFNCVNPPHDTMLKHITDLLPKIQKHAIAELGPETITIIVLAENKLSKLPIAQHLKKQMLATLSSAVASLDNVILIPGSLTFYKKLSDYQDPQKKLNKINNNYQALSKSSFINSDGKFLEQLSVFNEILHGKVDPAQTYCIQNNAYVLSKSLKTKHRKSFPWQESDGFCHSSFLYIGNDSLVKEIKLANATLDLSVIICREHDGFHTYRELSKHRPTVQVIVSNTIPTDQSKLCGAVNIHMDEKRELNILLDQSHPQAQSIKVTGGLYQVLLNGSVKQTSQNPAEIVHHSFKI